MLDMDDQAWISIARVGGLIDAIYRAAVDDSQWPPALAAISAAAGAADAMLFGVSRDRSIEPVCISRTVPLDWVRFYQESCIDDDEFRRLSPPVRPDAVVLSHELIPDGEIEQTFIYRTWSEPAGIGYFCSALMAVDGPLEFSLALLNSRADGPLGRAAVECLRALAPHVKRAIEINKQAARRETAVDGAFRALDAAGHALFLLGESGALVEANSSARALLEGEEVLRLNRGFLETGGDDGGHRIAAPTRRSDRPAASTVRLGAADGDRPLVGTLVALPDNRPSLLGRLGATARSALLVPLPGGDSERIAGRLSAVFELTPAEARLAAAIGQGRTLEDFAWKQGVNKETVRTQLKRIFAKTGTRRQAELALVVASLGQGSA